MPSVHTTTTASPDPSRPSATHGFGSLTFGRGDGGIGGHEPLGADEPGLVQQAVAQQPFGASRLSGWGSAPGRRCSAT